MAAIALAAATWAVWRSIVVVERKEESLDDAAQAFMKQLASQEGYTTALLYHIHAWYLRKIQVPLPDRRYDESQATRFREVEWLGVAQTARNQETRSNIGRVAEKESLSENGRGAEGALGKKSDNITHF
ncbi:hypothetical protein R3P38DRAFT_2781472 [Favolaschia claudopus]|uniref:Uncharacterized protein n=1 Tax=Favolaschia claudopus TaxID=2862362 RepID=A0AAW0B4T6_9AGAR